MYFTFTNLLFCLPGLNFGSFCIVPSVSDFNLGWGALIFISTTSPFLSIINWVNILCFPERKPSSLANYVLKLCCINLFICLSKHFLFSDLDKPSQPLKTGASSIEI